MNFLFRRSSFVAASASRRALVALISSETSLLPSFTALEPSACSRRSFAPVEIIELSSVRRRKFHSSANRLEFRATNAACAEYAVDEYVDEEKGGAKRGDEGLEIAKLGIAQDIVTQLANRGITKLFPIQRAVLEPAMQGRDMIGRARTGTGKTLAFGIPILDKIIRFQAKHGCGKNPMAMVLAPTRELARQVEKEFRESSRLHTLCVYGGSPINQQIRALNYGVDVVVGTPGRIIDLLNRGSLNLSEIQFIVLDEADQMLNVGFDEDVEVILEKMPLKRQTMMFSATMPPWIRKLTQRYLKDPINIDLVGDSDQKLPEGITIYSIVSDNYSKPSILGPLIKEHAKGGKCIVFTQTKRDADKLSYAMSRSFGCEALHGDISQNQRERTLAGFRDGRFNILIATDVAARGLDIPNVDLVIHYELPNTSELFVHRSGRTGRAGKKGSAILIHSHEQQRVVRGIEQDIGGKFIELPRITVDDGGEGMFGRMGGGRFDSYGRMGGSGFRRSGNYGGSGFGQSRGFDSSNDFGAPSSRRGSFRDTESGGFNSFGRSRSSSDASSRSGGSSFDRFGGFRDSGSGRSSSFGEFDSGRFGSNNFGNLSNSGSSRSSPRGSSESTESNFRKANGGFGEFGSGRSRGNDFGSLGSSASRRSRPRSSSEPRESSFGKDDDDDDDWP